jgi:hypothetical protein
MPNLVPNAKDKAYLDECLRLFKQKTVDLDLTDVQYQAFVDRVQLRIGCWDVMYWFRLASYAALNPLNAEYIDTKDER